MRAKTILGLMIFGTATLVISPTYITGQGGGKKGGIFGGDPGVLFDTYLAKGRPYFLISETRTLKEPLTQYAQEKGITNGQITRQQYLDFQEYMKTKTGGGAPGGTPGSGFKMGFPGGKKFGGDVTTPPPPGIPITPGVAPNPDAINQWADTEFKSRDKNGDAKLNPEEMPGSLRGNLTKWDKNGDGLIDLNEYREFFSARLQGNDSDNQIAKGIAIIIDDDELDRKVVVFRAGPGGKMPPGMPAWFKDLDTDSDGQVALYEWRKGNKDLNEFRNWDLNDDGFITPDEAVRTQTLLAKTGTKNTTLAGGERPQFGAGERPQFGGKEGRKGWGGMPQGDGTGERPQFGKKGKKFGGTQD